MRQEATRDAALQGKALRVNFGTAKCCKGIQQSGKGEWFLQEQSAGEAVPVRQEIGLRMAREDTQSAAVSRTRSSNTRCRTRGSEENGIVGTAAPLEFIVDRTNFQSGRPAHFWIEECR
jgi:hypothetical protein